MAELILAVCFTAVVFSSFMLIRNNFIFAARIFILDIEPISVGLRLHDQLPEYNEMLMHPKYWLLWTPEHWLAWVARRTT